MIGKRVQYNKDMSGVIVNQNNTHVLIQFESGAKYCTPKIGINISDVKIIENKKTLNENKQNRTTESP